MRTRSPLHIAAPLLVLAAALAIPLPVARAQNDMVYMQPGVTYAAPGQQSLNIPDLPTTTEHLNAVVVSAFDGKPVARVLVTSGDRRMAAMTDYEGRFSFDLRRVVLPAGSAPGLRPGGGSYPMTLQFQLRKPGYVPNTVALSLPSVQPDTPGPTFQLKIVPSATIVGHVDPDNGEPLPPGINVQLRRKTIQNGEAFWNPTGGTQVNTRGEFRFADLAPGDYKISSSAVYSANPTSGADSEPGLTTVFYPDALDAASAGSLHIGPTETVPVRLAPHSTSFYHVTIPIAGSGALQGAAIRLEPESPGLNLGFNQKDRAIEGYLPPGSYTARVTTEVTLQSDGGSSTGRGGGQSGGGTIATIVTGDGFGAPLGSARIRQFSNTQATATIPLEVGRAPLRTAPVTPLPSVDIAVNVHRDFSNPDAQAADPIFIGNTQGLRQRMPPVSLFFQSLDSSNPSASSIPPLQPDDPQDQFKLQNITEGAYRVVTQSILGGYVASATCGIADLLRDPLTVGAGGPGCSIEVTLRDDSASVSGTIATGAVPQTPADSSSNTPIYVMAIPLDRPQTYPLQSAFSPPGQFQLGNIPPGQYLFLAAHRQLFNELEYSNPDVMRRLTAQGTVVTLSGGQKAEIQLPLMPEEGN